MFILDDILLSPARGVAWVVNQVRQAATHEFESEADAVRNELRELYMMLEAGRISEQEFDARERPLLERLDRIESGNGDANNGSETDG
ncbi:MAG TPA: gas vesicle protein GvpG [Phycisphaerae bacterium]|nr:gas vesicle protein GvpG [Phycisphaerae bacterium]